MSLSAHFSTYQLFKMRISLLLTSLLFLFLIACEEDAPTRPECAVMTPPTNLSLNETLFLDLSFGQEFGQMADGLRKWQTNINIFVRGNAPQETMDEIDLIIEELDGLSNSIRIRRTTDENSANHILFLGLKEDYVALVEPQAAGIAESNSGFAAIAWNANLEIIRASACVDIINFSPAQKHILREELAQTLGLINDTELVDNTIFHQFIDTTESYSDIDQAMIGFILSSELQAGMCLNEVLDIVE